MPERPKRLSLVLLENKNHRFLIHWFLQVSYEPRVETKRNRFVSMEGHVDVPSDETSSVAELERHWKQLYMRTKEGRLQIFVVGGVLQCVVLTGRLCGSYLKG